jgi:hypothetical protein
VLDRAKRGPAAGTRREYFSLNSGLKSLVSPFDSSDLRIFDVSRRRVRRDDGWR